MNPAIIHKPDLRQLIENGWVHLRNQTLDSVDALLTSLGEVVFITDVTVNPNSRGLVTSTKGLDFHTDHHKAKYILWYCIEQTDLGGESILLDAENLFNSLSTEEQDALYQIRLYEHKVFDDDEESYPLVCNDTDGQRHFYYSLWLVNKQDQKNHALLAFQQAIRDSQFVKFKMQPNDILIVDNHRVLHGRTSINGSTNRLLKRYWIK